MISDVVAYAKRCHAFQIHSDFIHQALGHLHPTSSSWPFEMWGIDVIGPIPPSTSKGHQLILAVTNYFSKWAEAIPLKEVKTSDMVKCIKHHVLYHFGMPRRIIHDNRPQFISQAFQRFYNKFKSKSVSSMAYYPAAMVLQKHSTRPSTNFSRSLSQKVNMTGTRSWVNASGYTIQRWEPQQRLCHFSWYMDVKMYGHWKFRFHICVLPWQ